MVGNEVEKYQHRVYEPMTPFDVTGVVNRDPYEKIVSAIAERGFAKVFWFISSFEPAGRNEPTLLL